MKEMKTTAQVLVDCLEAEGVDVMFGIPGEETLDLMFAIRDSKIRFIPVRHEQGAAFMADVYGRLTGRAGVCLSTLGPGATNLVTGVADAYLDGAPLVAITGQVGTDRMQLTSHQYLDLTAMFEPITKRSKQIIRPDTVGEIVRLAFKHAEKGKPGATHIDLPQNIAKMPADAVPLKRQQMHEVYADPTHIAAAGKIISEAKNPVILAGAGAVRGHAAAAVTELADRLHIPVVNTMMAKGIIPMDDKYSLLTIGYLFCSLHQRPLAVPCIRFGPWCGPCVLQGLDRRIDRLPGFFRLDHAVYDTQFLGYPSGQKKLNR